MIYLSGPLAFCVPCDLPTPGEWRISPSMWTDENTNKHLRNTDDYPFKDYGIEKNKYIQYRPICLYNVANHVRAYLDMLYEERFSEMEEMFRNYIDNGKCRREIFDQVYYRCRNLAEFHDINTFMAKEFGNAWYSYIDAMKKAAEHLAVQMESAKDFIDNPDTAPSIADMIKNTNKGMDLTGVDIPELLSSSGIDAIKVATKKRG